MINSTSSNKKQPSKALIKRIKAGLARYGGIWHIDTNTREVYKVKADKVRRKLEF